MLIHGVYIILCITVVPAAVKGRSLVGVWSDIRVPNVRKILFRADKGRSHKTSRSHIRGSFVARTTVLQQQ